jgi:hypothetical protein
MFDLNALVMLTICNLIALVQIASNILVPAKLQRGPILGAAAVCLATSLTGLAIAILIPSPVVDIASVTIAALVNLFAVLGTGLDRLSDPSSIEAARFLRGLVRLAIIGAPHESAIAGLPRSISASARVQSARVNKQTTAALDTSDPLVRLLEAASKRAPSAPKPNRPAANAARTPASAQPLTRRHNYSVPRRPNRLPTSSLAFLLSVDPEDAPDIFADARANMNQLSALAHRVRPVAIDPGHSTITSQSTSIWPKTFSEPDPAWATSYGRFPAVAPGV